MNIVCFSWAPKGWVKHANCQKFEQWAAVSPTSYDIECHFVFIPNRKSHTDFPLIPSSMALNDLERRHSRYMAFLSPNYLAVVANYATVFEDRHIMSEKHCFPFPLFHLVYGQNCCRPKRRQIVRLWSKRRHRVSQNGANTKRRQIVWSQRRQL